MSIDPLRLEYMERQSELYDRLKPTLLKDYGGQFIAFENGIVLDFDRDERQLAQRVYRTHGYRDLLITQVLEKEPQLSIASTIVR
jgi:hypothetical protein